MIKKDKCLIGSKIKVKPILSHGSVVMIIPGESPLTEIDFFTTDNSSCNEALYGDKIYSNDILEILDSPKKKNRINLIKIRKYFSETNYKDSYCYCTNLRSSADHI